MIKGKKQLRKKFTKILSRILEKGEGSTKINLF